MFRFNNRPDVHFHCNINRDPFLFMEQHNKTYCKILFHVVHSKLNEFISLQNDLAFTITMYEYEATIPTLWGHVQGTSSTPNVFFFFCPKLTMEVYIDFAREHPEYIAEDNSMGFMTGEGEKYNLCHCQNTSSRLPCLLLI